MSKIIEHQKLLIGINICAFQPAIFSSIMILFFFNYLRFAIRHPTFSQKICRNSSNFIHNSFTECGCPSRVVRSSWNFFTSFHILKNYSFQVKTTSIRILHVLMSRSLLLSFSFFSHKTNQYNAHAINVYAPLSFGHNKYHLVFINSSPLILDHFRF